MHCCIPAVLLFLPAFSSANVYNVTESSQTETKITERVNDVGNKTDRRDHVILHDWFAAPSLLPISVAASDNIRSPRCRNQSQLFLQELRNFTLWAVQMFDSAAKIPVGVLAGNQYQLGHYDECVEISVDVGERFGGKLTGQYCLAEIQFNSSFSSRTDPYTLNYDPRTSAWEKITYRHDPAKVRRDILHWALCTPASCSPEELHDVLKHELSKIGESQGIHFTSRISQDLCHTQDHDSSFSTGDIIYLFILVSLVFLLVSSTWYDFTFSTDLPEKGAEPTTKKPSKLETAFLCFSARRNLKKLASQNSIHPALDASHGSRLMFMLFIIMGHRITTFGGHPIFNAETEERLFQNASAMLLANGPVIVDGFFALSGILLSYPLLAHLAKTERINIVMPIFVRFIRLTPSYMMIVFFHATLLPHMGSGPFWDATVGLEQRRCATNWWSNLLYINNYVNVGDMCMFQSWYLAADFQLYIVCLLTVCAIWHWPRLGYTALGALMALSTIIPFVLIYQNEAAPLLYPYPENIRDVRASWYFQSIYVATHNRAAPYVVGVIIGVLLYKLRNSSHRLGKLLSHIAYLTCVWGLGVAILMSVYVFFIPGRPYNALEAALYGSLHRIGFAFAVGGFFVLITWGQINIYQRFFSLKPFVVLSRLTYGAYLTHTMGQLYDQGTLRVPRYLSPYTGMWFTFGDVTFAFGVSLFLLLLVEAPFRSIEKIVFAKKHK